MAAFCILLPLSACEEKVVVSNTEIVFSVDLNEEQLFRIEGELCTVAEAKLLLAVTKNRYEESFGSEIWDQKVAGIAMENYVKDMVRDQLAQLTCMYLYAKEEGISLTIEETGLVKEASNLYFEMLGEENNSLLGIELDDIEDIFTRYAYAKKIFDEKTKDVKQEISDSEAKVIVVQHIFKSTEGKNDTEKDDIRSLMVEYSMQLSEGADFMSMAEEYSDDSRIEYSFGRGEMEQSFESAAFGLAVGEVSRVVETGSGYHIIKCVSDYDTGLTERNKARILEERQQEKFQDGYQDYTDKLLSELNEPAWNKISFESIKGVTVNELFEVYLQETGEE